MGVEHGRLEPHRRAGDLDLLGRADQQHDPGPQHLALGQGDAVAPGRSGAPSSAYTAFSTSTLSAPGEG